MQPSCHSANANTYTVDNPRREFDDEWLPPLQTITHRQYNDWRALTAHLLAKGQTEELSRLTCDHEEKVLRPGVDLIEEIFAPWDAGPDRAFSTLMSVVKQHVSLSRLLRRQRACLSVIYPGVPVVQGSPVEVIKFDHTTMKDLDDRIEGDRPDLIARFLESPALYVRGNCHGDHFDRQAIVLVKAQVEFDWLPVKEETTQAGHDTA